ncbi:MAG: YadA-like family protein [Candidatus Protistobacter heckmanni]|nr:YadA-like family protein [Candidatus Protistobacter heckmanni]
MKKRRIIVLPAAALTFGVVSGEARALDVRMCDGANKYSQLTSTGVVMVLCSGSAYLSIYGPITGSIIDMPSDGSITIKTTSSDLTLSGKNISFDNKRLQGVADGVDPSDAATVRQLNSLSTTIQGIADMLPATPATPGATAFGKSSQATGANATALGSNTVAAGANSVAVGNNSVATRANTVSFGSAGNERALTNVAAGTAPTDAVNRAQLDATYTKLAKAVAGTTALAMIPGAQTGDMGVVGVGVGVYDGNAGVALGASMSVARAVSVKMGIALASSSSPTFGGGVGYRW